MEYREENIVRLNFDVENQVREFLERTRRSIKVLKEALAKEDYENIWIIGKRMKEEAQQYGFSEIMDTGAALENAASEKNDREIRAKTAGLAEWLRNIRIVYE